MINNDEEWGKVKLQVIGGMIRRDQISYQVSGVVWYRNPDFMHDPVEDQIDDQVLDQVIAEIKNDK